MWWPLEWAVFDATTRNEQTLQGVCMLRRPCRGPSVKGLNGGVCGEVRIEAVDVVSS